MKKAFVLILSVFPMIASGDYLDDKIADLTKQKLEKIAELEECQKSTKGLKIAGITTLGVSTVGIAANIGEAVALKKLDGQISEAETKLGDLDEKIQDKKDENERKEQQANTCGVQQCNPAERDAKTATLNAKDVVCVNGAWVPSACNDGFSGTTETCTLNSETVTYYKSCKQDAKKCDTITEAWKEQNHVEQVECDTTTGEYYITKCKNGYSGTRRTSGKEKGYEMCRKNEGGKKQDNKSGEKSGGGDATTTIKDCSRAIPSVSYVLNCEGRCNQYATQNGCKIKEIYEGTAGCICNPNDADKGNQKNEGGKKQDDKSGEKSDVHDRQECSSAWKKRYNVKRATCDEYDRGMKILECEDGYQEVLVGGKIDRCVKVPQIDDAWRKRFNAKAGKYDFSSGSMYITECEDGYMPERDTYGNIQKCDKYLSDDGKSCLSKEFTFTYQPCEMICKNYARNTGCQIKDHAEDKGTGKCICNPNIKS